MFEFVVLHTFILLSFLSIHLPHIVFLNAPKNPPGTVTMTMLVLRLAIFLLMKNNTYHIPRNTGITHIPVMASIPARDCDTILVRHDDVEMLQILYFKHWQSPSFRIPLFSQPQSKFSIPFAPSRISAPASSFSLPRRSSLLSSTASSPHPL